MTTDAGFLSDLDLDKVEADPNFLPDGKYPAFLFKAKVQAYKDSAKGKALILTYKIADGPHKGKTVDEWKSCNSFDEPSKKAWLKQRLISLGVPESKFSTLNPDDLVGLAVSIKVKKNGDFTNVNFVELRDEDDLVPSDGEVTGSPVSASVSDSLL